ncbi:MAG: hypothetical protein RXQ96_00985 [Thermocladium sp.]
MPSPGQFLGNEERRPIPPAIPGEDTKEIKTIIRGLTWFASYQMDSRKGS